VPSTLIPNLTSVIPNLTSVPTIANKSTAVQ
jgi:hypothetical protein